MISPTTFASFGNYSGYIKCLDGHTHFTATNAGILTIPFGCSANTDHWHMSAADSFFIDEEKAWVKTVPFNMDITSFVPDIDFKHLAEVLSDANNHLSVLDHIDLTTAAAHAGPVTITSILHGLVPSSITIGSIICIAISGFLIYRCRRSRPNHAPSAPPLSLLIQAPQTQEKSTFRPEQ